MEKHVFILVKYSLPVQLLKTPLCTSLQRQGIHKVCILHRVKARGSTLNDGDTISGAIKSIATKFKNTKKYTSQTEYNQYC